MKLPDILVGKSHKRKEHFPMRFFNSTSADWGFVQPLCKIELIPDTDMKIKTRIGVRLGSMPVPTFGNIEYKTYHRFIPIADLWPPFENMLEGKPYHTSLASVVPLSVPQCNIHDLTLFCLTMFDNIFTVYISQRDTSKMVVATNEQSNAILTYFQEHILSFTSGNFAPINGNCATNQHDVPGSAFDPITPNGSDFNVILSGYTFEQHPHDVMLCFRLNEKARNFRKVMIGLGYQLDLENNEPLSFLPFFAYYKAYFDYFAPQQTVTWTSTNAYKLLDTYRERPDQTGVAYIGALDDKNSLVSNFFYDLTACYYTEDPNFVSSHIATPAISDSSSFIYPNNAKNLSLDTQHPTIADPNSQPQLVVSSTATGSGVTANKITALMRLQTYVGKQTIIGGRIGDFLKAVLGADYLGDDRSYHIGTDTVDCQIDDIYSTNENDKVDLGEYAGRGIGGSESSQMRYHTSTYGYYIALGVIVANSDFSQGVDPNLKHLSKLQYYTPDFDAVGYQITEKDAVVGEKVDSVDGVVQAPAPFGYIPRYSEYKVPRSILNGMITLRSTRDSYLPYTLDKFISPVNVVAIPMSTDGKPLDPTADEGTEIAYYQMSIVNHNLPIASTEWKYQGKYRWIGNLNRVFNNSGYEDSYFKLGSHDSALTAEQKYLYDPIDDNFVIHHAFDVELNAPMLSMAESYDTDPQADNTISVEKA